MTQSEANNNAKWYRLPYRIRRKITKAIKKGRNDVELKTSDYALSFFDSFISPMDIINANDILKDLGYNVAQNIGAYDNHFKYKSWISW